MFHLADSLRRKCADFLSFMLADGEARADKRESEPALLQSQIAYSALSRQFAITLSLATLIAAFGLMADSTVVIVGAMLIAPLMKPIMALAFGVVISNRRLCVRSLITIAVGILATILVAMISEAALGLREPTTEIMSRTQPTLIDLGIAIAAGVAAALASTRRNVADTLPGVAIAVSLVPPLCVAGIGLSIGAWTIAEGAAMLFAVNLVAIVLAATAVFLVEGFGSLRLAWRGIAIFIVIAAALSSPLDKALNTLRADDLAQKVIEDYLHEQYLINEIVHPNDLSRLSTIMAPDHVFVFLEVKSPEEILTDAEGEELHRRLTTAFKMPVNLKVQLLLSKELKIYASRLPDGSMPDYGRSDLIPRR